MLNFCVKHRYNYMAGRSGSISEPNHPSQHDVDNERLKWIIGEIVEEAC